MSDATPKEFADNALEVATLRALASRARRRAIGQPCREAARIWLESAEEFDAQADALVRKLLGVRPGKAAPQGAALAVCADAADV